MREKGEWGREEARKVLFPAVSRLWVVSDDNRDNDDDDDDEVHVFYMRSTNT